MNTSNRPAPKPYCKEERYAELKGLHDAMFKILTEMDLSNPLYWGAVNRMLIAENMITEHLLTEMTT